MSDWIEDLKSDPDGRVLLAIEKGHLEASEAAAKALQERSHRIAELEAELRAFTCVFCATRIQADSDADSQALREATRLHMLVCEKHPMRRLEADNARLRGMAYVGAGDTPTCRQMMELYQDRATKAEAQRDRLAELLDECADNVTARDLAQGAALPQDREWLEDWIARAKAELEADHV